MRGAINQKGNWVVVSGRILAASYDRLASSRVQFAVGTADSPVLPQQRFNSMINCQSNSNAKTFTRTSASWQI